MPWFDNNDKPISVNHTEMIERVENDIRLYGKDLRCYVIISSRSVTNSPDIQMVSRFSLKKIYYRRYDRQRIRPINYA